MCTGELQLKPPPSLKTPPSNFGVCALAFRWCYLTSLQVFKSSYNQRILAFSTNSLSKKFMQPKETFLSNLSIPKSSFLLRNSAQFFIFPVLDRNLRHSYFAPQIHNFGNQYKLVPQPCVYKAAHFSFVAEFSTCLLFDDRSYTLFLFE